MVAAAQSVERVIPGQEVHVFDPCSWPPLSTGWVGVSIM